MNIFFGLKCHLTNSCCCTVSRSANLNSLHICRVYFHAQTYLVKTFFYYWAKRRINILVDLIIYCSFAQTSYCFFFSKYLFSVQSHETQSSSSSTVCKYLAYFSFLFMCSVKSQIEMQFCSTHTQLDRSTSVQVNFKVIEMLACCNFSIIISHTDAQESFINVQCLCCFSLEFITEKMYLVQLFVVVRPISFSTVKQIRAVCVQCVHTMLMTIYITRTAHPSQRVGIQRPFTQNFLHLKM